MERVQGRALRAVFNNTAVAYEKLLKWADILSLENRRFQDILILMYKVKYNLVPKSISDIFCNCNKKYKVMWTSLSPDIALFLMEDIIRYIGPYLWGKLRKDPRCKPNLQSFKSAIRNMDIA